MRIAIIGGGAAGFFAAINIKMKSPDAKVTIYERGTHPLAKVKVSGGGRCNLTNSFANISSLNRVYPRGEKLMNRALKHFSHRDTYQWFEEHGVKLVTQDDECVFPRSQSSGEIIDTFLKLSRKYGVDIVSGINIETIRKDEGIFYLDIKGGDVISADIVIVTIGGTSERRLSKLLENIPVNITSTLPSLFSFNINHSPLNELTGCVIANSYVSLCGSKLQSNGALLITHWGMSGPAILKLSSYAAKELYDVDYKAKISVNWCGERNEDGVRATLEGIITENPKKQLSTVVPFNLTSRFWNYLLSRSGVMADRKWGEIGRKNINSIIQVLTNDVYEISDKSTHKEEFVTCGGVDLKSINLSTLCAKECSNIYFAGEVLDIDAITGGFNLQAAWSTAHMVSEVINKAICKIS